MFYSNLKKFLKNFPTFWKFLIWLKYWFLKSLRLKDVFMMMTLLHIWPQQTYRFSTRKYLPCKKNRFSKESKLTIPYDLLNVKSSNMPKMKEINVVGIGNSFNLDRIKDLSGPIFLISFWGPLRTDKNGKIFYRHFYSYKTDTYDNAESLFVDDENKEFRSDNLIYVNPRHEVIERFKKNGNNVVGVNLYATDREGKHFPLSGHWETPAYLNLFDDKKVKRIALAEKVYKPPLLSPHPYWTPSKSFLSNFCAISFFAEKINVYGWDFYLNSSPEEMSYWKLFFQMYKFKNDDRCREHFESALINFYYGNQISQLPNIKVHGYMGQLNKHHNLINRIEKVLFN